MLPSSPHADSSRILVVDDDRDTVETMAILLRHFGHEVQTAFDGYQAIWIAHRQRPSHVLLDLAMPGMDGYQVAARLRKELPGPITLIAITGFTQAEERRRALEAGFDHYLIKPVELDDLSTLLSEPDSGPWVRQTVSDAEPMADEETIGLASPRDEPGESPIGGEISPRGDKSTAVATSEGPPKLLVRRRVEMTNPLGLHLRAATKIVQLARQFQAEVWVACDGRKVSGRSMIDMMTLAASCGSRLELEADGPDAEAALDALVELIGRGFDEAGG